MFLPLVTSGDTVPLDQFWVAVMVYHNRPQLVNKKLSAVLQAYFYKVELTHLENFMEYFTHSAIIYEVRKLPELTINALKTIISDILIVYDKDLIIVEHDVRDFQNSSGVFISLRILLPKNANSKKCIEIAILDKNKNVATFYAVMDEKDIIIAPKFPYHFEWTHLGHVRCIVDSIKDADSNSADWLVDKLFPKLIKWAQDGVCDKPQEALQLIHVDRYTDLYQNLKAKYGKKMIEIWPENTDPLKFVYEDIAIATYLICLWDIEHGPIKPSFLDLGCGNGLLVYILSQEGYEGYGIDVRKRKIWDLYPSNVNLEEKTIVPSSSSLFPNIDWILGNHSDELTPWIPIITSRSSYKANFFLLPCCSYDFSGKKYSRLNTSKSVYNEYIEYVQNICIKCGFIIKIDKLKIPSTKRTCLISYGRSYTQCAFQDVDADVTKFIQSRSQTDNKTSNVWIGDFQARPNVEKVRNCTKLDRCLVGRVILRIVNKLLETKNCVQGYNGTWNSGGTIAIHDFISSIPKEDLKQLKNECGGLQTLMRNHRYIFQVERGYVKLRLPRTYNEITRYKEKLCWFFNNHPDGCLHSRENCIYKHV